MKIVVFGPARRVGALVDGEVIDLNGAYAKHAYEVQGDRLPAAVAAATVPAQLQEFIEAGPRALEGAERAIEYLRTQAGDTAGLSGEPLVHAGDSVKIHAPLPSRATRIAMAGGNFADHAQGMYRMRNPDITLEEAVEEVRKTGFWGFWKLANNVVGPDEDVIYPARTQRLDYEGEVTIVLGSEATDVRADRVEQYIWGYTLQNDWSLRDEREAGNFKFVTAKNFNTSSSLGPCIVVGEIPDCQNVDFETTVNGEIRQRGNTQGMIFSFGEFLEHLTRDHTLLPGEMLSGGTCAGTAADASERDENGVARPDLFITPGDVVEVSSPQIGVLRSRVVAKRPRE